MLSKFLFDGALVICLGILFYTNYTHLCWWYCRQYWLCALHNLSTFVNQFNCNSQSCYNVFVIKIQLKRIVKTIDIQKMSNIRKYENFCLFNCCAIMQQIICFKKSFLSAYLNYGYDEQIFYWKVLFHIQWKCQSFKCCRKLKLPSYVILLVFDLFSHCSTICYPMPVLQWRS